MTLAVRDTDAGERVAADIRRRPGDPSRVGRLDLADQASVAAFVAGWDGPLHILVNNAGVMALPELRAHARGLGDAVRDQPPRPLRARHRPARRARGGRRGARSSRSARAATCARRSSSTTSTSTRRPYDPWLAYGQSKTANVLFAVEATRRWARRRHHRQRAHARARSSTPTCSATWTPRCWRDGCAVRAPTASRRSSRAPRPRSSSRPRRCSRAIGGRYFEDCNEAPVVEGPSDARAGVAAYALDPGDAARLWEISEVLVWERVATAGAR